MKKNILESDVSISRINIAQKAVFAKNLSMMLGSGLTLIEALEIIADQMSGKFKKAIEGVLSSVQSGQTLSSSFARYPRVFTGIFVNITRAGEEAGTLEENLEDIAGHLKKDSDLISKIKGALLYPVVVLVASFILGLAIAFIVLPKITPLFRGLRVELPLTTRMLIWFSDMIQAYGLYIFIGIVALAVILIWAVKQKFSHPFTHLLLIKIPVVKDIVKNTNIARFSRTLGTLIKGGLNIDQALEITQNTINNHYYKKIIPGAVKHVSKGGKLSESLGEYEKLFPKMATRMIGVGEKSGKIEETLFYLAEYHENEVDNSTKSLTIVIEPALLIFIGLVVAFLALSIITPIYQITGNVRG